MGSAAATVAETEAVPPAAALPVLEDGGEDREEDRRTGRGEGRGEDQGQDMYGNMFWLKALDKHKEMDKQLRDFWEAASVLYGIFILVLGVLILLSVLVSLCAVKLFLFDRDFTIKIVMNPILAAVPVGVTAIWNFFHKLLAVASITDKCMSKAVSKKSIYSTAVQARVRDASSDDRADHRDFLNYLDRNPTGVIIGTLIDTPFVCKILISLGTVCVSIWSYMVAMVGLKSIPVARPKLVLL